MKIKNFFQPFLCLLLVTFIFFITGHYKQERLIDFFNKYTSCFFNRETTTFAGDVKVVGRQLIVDGKPFIIKGVCYSPVRKGCLYPSGLITLNPSAEDLLTIEKDFQMMHEAGINTIRTYEPLLDQRILDLLVKYQLRTIVPVINNRFAPFQKVASTVVCLKNHPSTLIWEIGNEWNHNYFYSKEIDPEHPDGLELNDAIRFLKNQVRYIKLLDTKHPVSTDIGSSSIKNESFWTTLFALKSVDLFGLNIYDGLSFGNYLEKWASHMTKPLYIGEFGADAFNTKINAEDDASQEVATRTLITKILNQLSALNPNHVLVGGCIFEWSDEWWKDPKGSANTHDNGGITEPGEGPYPDYVFNEEWFGIVDIDRNPRPAYWTLKELYSKKIVTANVPSAVL